MANKKMVDVDKLSSLADNDSLFVNSDGALKQVDVSDAGLMRMELLWENASPTSVMDVQTLSVDTSGYTHWAVLGRLTINNVASKLFIGRVGDRILMDFAYGSASKVANYYRSMSYTSATQITV